MPFPRENGVSYRPLEASKYVCGETDELRGSIQTSQSDPGNDDLVGYSLDFAQPKDSFVGQVKQSCEAMKRKVFTALHFFLSVVFGKWPFALIVLKLYVGLTIVLIVVALTGKYHEFRKDLSLDSFLVPDIKVSSDYAAFNAAKKQDKSSNVYSFPAFLKTDTCVDNEINPSEGKIRRRSKRSPVDQGSYFQHLYSGSLNLVYVAKGDNVFTKQNLDEIHDIEKTLMQHKNYDRHCWISTDKNINSLGKYGNCSPLLSVIGAFYSEKGKVDGHSDDLSRPINETLRYLRSKESFFSFVSDDFSKTKKSKILRASIPFGKPLRGVDDSAAEKDEFKRYLITYIDILERLNNNNHVSILYGGGDLFDYLVNRALISDLHLAGTSLGLILLLLLILTFSLWLSLMAVVTILSSVAFAYFFYHVVFGIQYMGILNGVSLFVIIGIGVDDIFVFINTFRQAVDNENLGNRIVHTIYVAGKATFFTSFTTAAAFGANALSPIPAIHDFGVFMAVLVTSCWVSVLFIISPSLTLWHAGIEKLESGLFKKVLSVIGVGKSDRMRLPDDIRRFLSGNRPDEPEAEVIPLVRSNNDGDVNEDDDDEPLLVLDDESSSNQNVYARNPIGFRLQSILYHFVAEPVVKGRVVIFVIYLFILAGSAVLVSKLQVSTEQPKFFKADSNLERWLELPEVNLKKRQDILEDIKDVQKGNGRPASAPPIYSPTSPGNQKTTHTQRKNVPTSHPRTTTVKSFTTRSKSPNTRPPSTTFTHTSEKHDVVNTTLSNTTMTTNKPPVTKPPIYKETIKKKTLPTTTFTYTVESTEPKVPSDTSVTTNRPTVVTTSPLNKSSESDCPYKCANGRCNKTTQKCECFFSYTGETCSKYCPVRTMSGKCCFIPFIQNGEPRKGCLIDEKTKKAWCSLTQNYDTDGKKEDCNTTVENRCAVRTETPNKTCCNFPFTYENVEYYSCIKTPFLEGSCCSIKPQVSSVSDLKRCIEVKPSICDGPDKCVPVTAQPNQATALVYLVFGIKGLDKSSVDLRHVLKQTEGKVIYDKVFSKAVSCDTERLLKAACRICKKFSDNTHLVRLRDAQCFPESVQGALESRFPDCRNLPSTKSKNIKSIVVMKKDPAGRDIVEWIAMAFSSTTGTLSSYGSEHNDYDKWEKYLKEVLSEDDIPDSLKHGFQTSETWVKMFSGVIVVNSAVYGIVVSLLLCLAAVMIFTGHALLFIILFMTILGVLLKVTAIFYLTGWQLGGVEAISLSILVGTSVDYCFHLVEGYILAGNAVDPSLDAKAARQWRAKAAMSHIGMPIISSAVTTILAAIPLCVTQIQLFAKFGLIVTINTAISLLYTITVTMAMLSIFGPSKFRASLRACGIGLIVVKVLGGLGVLILYLMSTQGGHCIQGPSGAPLFDCGK